MKIEEGKVLEYPRVWPAQRKDPDPHGTQPDERARKDEVTVTPMSLGSLYRGHKNN